MLKQVPSRRSAVLMALLMLAVALLVVGANSAYATHEPDDDPPTLPYFDDFGLPQDYRGNSDDVIHWDENEDEPQDCAVKNAGGTNMALQLSNGCDAYVSFEVPYGGSLVLEYDWGYRTTGGTDDDGDLEVRVVQLVRSTEPNTLNTLSTYTHSFQPKSNTGPIYPSGEVRFDLVSLGLQTETEEGTTIIQVHFVGSSTGASDWAWVDNVDITWGRDPLVDGTHSYSQGHYGQGDEQLTCDILAGLARSDSDGLADSTVAKILDILESPRVVGETVGVEDVGGLCLFLVGEIGTDGGNNDCGFLPAGKLLDENGGSHPKSNLAAQTITLQLNYNLDLVLSEDEFPIDPEDFLNIDPVQDIVDGQLGPMYYPLVTTNGALGACDAGFVQELCADDTADLFEMGYMVLALDTAREGTTVQDIEDAALALLGLAYSNPSVEMVGEGLGEDLFINGVQISDDLQTAEVMVTEILSLINKSYDEGVPTGFVTDWDVD